MDIQPASGLAFDRARATSPAPRSPRDLPGPAALPWIGSARAFLSHPGDFFLRNYRRFGPIFQTHLFGTRIVAMIGPEANRLILAEQRERFSHARGYEMVTEMLGDGLIFQDGAAHRRNRTLMTPAFHTAGVQRYFTVMSDLARAHVARWAAEGAGPMYERFRHFTFEVAARLILGARGEVEVAALSRLNDRLGKGTTAFLRVGAPWTTYGQGLRARDELHAYLRGVIRARRADPGDDALGLLIAARDENGETLDEDELLDQAVILLFAGHETTTSMLTSLLFVLDAHPDIRRQVVDEQRQVVGEDDLTLGHVKRLGYLDLVLKEVERLYPPVSICQRGVLEDVEFAGCRLPAGTTVSYSPYATHRLPAVFRDPERFDPERFAPPREEHKATPYSLVGFGGGPRLCLGQAFAQMEMKIVASLLLRRYRWRLLDVPPRFTWVPTLHPRSGLPAEIRPGNGAGPLST
jgi:cytochrome P450